MIGLSRWIGVCYLLLLPASVRAEEPATVELARDGKAIVPIVVSKEATSRVKGAAQTLATMLQRITSAKFSLITGDGRSGIAVGRQGDFANIPLRPLWDGKDPTRREDYLLESHVRGVQLIGTTDLAVEHAVWDFLYRVGYRQYFPGPTWEVLPSHRVLRVSVKTRQHPSYLARRIWYGYGAAPWSSAHYADWCAKNRATSGIVLNTGHAYDGIFSRNKAEFDRHPEYLGLINGKRKSSKFCISNPGLRELVVADALKQMAKEPTRQSLSVDPSDGPGWCECPKCKAMGSVTDRALTLANEVAEAVNRKYPGTYIGMYAYSQHSPPPNIKVHPRVIISVATAYIQGGYSQDELLSGWAKKGATLGIREYFSVNVWDRDLPGKPRAAKVSYLAQTIPHFYHQGARFFSAESSDNWGPCGLGYYLASRFLWNIEDIKDLETIRKDFLSRAFGPAQAAMGKYYDLIDGTSRPLLTDDLLGRLYRALSDAMKSTRDEKIQKRIADLVLYTRYLELWLDYSTATGQDRQKAFETMIRHAYRMRETMMIHTWGLARDLPRRDKTITMPTQAGPRVPVGKNLWMSKEPFRASEIETILTKGIASRSLFDFTPLSFSDNLVPATPLKLSQVGKPGTFGLYLRGVRNHHTWVEKAPATITLKVQAGRIYTNRGPAHIRLFPHEEVESNSVAEAKVEPDRKTHPVELQTKYRGAHRIEIADHSAGTAIEWQVGMANTIQSSLDSPAVLHGRWALYFYVPRGTLIVGGYSSGEGSLLDGSGKVIHSFPTKPGYFSIKVPSGQDGKLWKFDRCVGQKLLMTVPPYLATGAKELLLPAEVVKRDTTK